ncbi:PINc/VapC family ATPase [Methanolapillus millepedarum]
MSFDPHKKYTSEIIVADTSAVIDGVLSRGIIAGRYSSEKKRTVVIPEAVLSELEHQANSGKEIGFLGLSEIVILQEMNTDEIIRLTFAGGRPERHRIADAASGAVDALIRETAIEFGGLFVTSDKVQAAVGVARGLYVDFVPSAVRLGEDEKFDDSYDSYFNLSVLSFFDKTTMSVHLKNNCLPMAKKGSVGEMKYVPIRDAVTDAAELSKIRAELVEFAKHDSDSFIEMESDDPMSALVLQIRDMRIAITSAPFSDDTEITLVRPIASVDFEKYKASDELKNRILEQRGVLIAGSPGAGKSTFAAGVARFLLSAGNVVKTMESPRDLQVPAEVTQYSPLDGKMENTADLLLLVRPDYTIYDEVRKTKDFLLFADMRLAGVGMIGVVHATRAIDAVQRLIGRVELGIIPQVVDTVIFIDKGEIAKVYTLEFTVKVPSGMLEADLARPVIVVSDMASKVVEYEIYTYGEQVVVMPVGAALSSQNHESVRKPSWDGMESKIKSEIARYVSGPVDAEMISDRSAVVKVKLSDKRKVIGRGGDTINQIESKLGIRIDVRELTMRDRRNVKKTMFGESISSSYHPYDSSRFGPSSFDEESGFSPESGFKQDNILEEWTDETVDDVDDVDENDYVIPIFEKTKKHFILKVPELSGEDVDVFMGGRMLFSATVGRTGEIKLRADSELAAKIRNGFRNGELVDVRLSAD